MNNLLVSVIIPVFNAEKYLNLCIDSILKQTVKDFELLLINDASDDGSANICDYYASKDERIRVFHQKINGGECVSRNIGLNNAKGKYIIYIDADDSVLENHIESLLYSNNIPSGTLVHAPHMIERNGEILNKSNIPKFSITNFNENKTQFDYLFAGPAWSKLIENDLVKKNNLQFRPGIRLNGDHIFHLEYLLHITSYVNVGVRTLIYYDRIDSISKKQFPFDECFQRVKIMIPLTERVVKRFNLTNPNVINNLYSTPISALIQAIYSLYRIPYKKPRSKRLELLNVLLDEYSLYINEYWNPKSMAEKFIKKVIATKKIYFIDIIVLPIITIRYNMKSFINLIIK